MFQRIRRRGGVPPAARVTTDTAAARGADPSTLAVVVEDATKKFGDVVAVGGVSLVVPFGSILGVIGPSGAGKTTTIRLLTGALAPTSGRVRVLGEQPTRFRRRTRERIGYMPQSFTLYPDLTASENIDFVASLFGMLFFRRRSRGGQVLKLVDLWDARGRRAGDLSGGMQRRLELACALVHDPTLLFLDEPTAGIDPLLRARIWDELHRLREIGRTLIVTTQYVTEAEECDSVALIANGQLVALGTPTELRRAAVGGDIVEVETTDTFDAARLVDSRVIRKVRQLGPRSVQAIVEDAGTATPAIVDAVGAAGGEVAAAREHRLSFDEVFAELVRRSDPSAAGGGGGPRPPPGPGERRLPIIGQLIQEERHGGPRLPLGDQVRDEGALSVVVGVGAMHVVAGPLPAQVQPGQQLRQPARGAQPQPVTDRL
jgi:ABC-2 type transport system ATP-binding protein